MKWKIYFFSRSLSCVHLYTMLRGGDDNSLARQRMKQDTATKLVFIQHTPYEAQ
jgi:hypothetical protein